MKQGQMCLIEWADTFSIGEWHDEEDIDELAMNAERKEKTVGFFIKEIGDFIVIATHRNAVNGFKDWGDINFITKGAIKKIKKLK